MQSVTLTQVLEERDNRAARQKDLLAAYSCPLISFTMNIAGPVKISPLIERAFAEGLSFLEQALPPEKIRFAESRAAITGCLAMYCVDLDPLALKKICVKIEEATPLGRLFDMDVLDMDGRKLTRSMVSAHDSRGCMVCGAPGRTCQAGRLHSVSQLQEATRSILNEYFAEADAGRIGDMAVQSLLDEVYTTPKPGLVDRCSNGSHRDMDLSTFLASARALRPYFQQCVTIGQRTASKPPSETFPFLRDAGLAAEAVMFTATCGVNTHKGIIYTMGILCGALGRLWTPELPFAPTRQLLSTCAQIAADAAEADLTQAAKEGVSHTVPTAGLSLYKALGLTGIRGEAAAGLPSVAKIGLPIYKQALEAGLTPNDAGAAALLHLIANVSDTNLYHRGGPDGAAFAAASARALLSNSAFPTADQIAKLDQAFISRNLSPGGCADLLAVTYFLYALEHSAIRHAKGI